MTNLPVPSPATQLAPEAPERPGEVTLARRAVFQGSLLRVWEDTIRLPSGQVITRELVEHPGSAVVVPVDDHWNVWLVRRYRRQAGRATLELPAGLLQGDGPVAAARRGLAAAVGLAARTLDHLVTLWPSGAHSSEVAAVYLGLGLRPARGPEPEPERLEVVRLPLDGAVARIWSGEIDDARTVAGLLLARAALDGRQTGASG
ncbi:MAG TPA: NUDIX hydrolase [Actinomycetes bacterium]|nr:NUDIX hydrolase [Actinomycetes bacterium]